MLCEALWNRECGRITTSFHRDSGWLNRTSALTRDDEAHQVAVLTDIDVVTGSRVCGCGLGLGTKRQGKCYVQSPQRAAQILPGVHDGAVQ